MRRRKWKTFSDKPIWTTSTVSGGGYKEALHFLENPEEKVMFRLMKDFNAKMFVNPIQAAWLMLLILVNGVIPLFFFHSIEAKVALLCLVLGMMTGIAIFKVQGFTRLLGLMHLPWPFLIIFLWGRLGQTPATGFFGIWIRVVILLNSISLVFDAIDVIKYATGDRKPAR